MQGKTEGGASTTANGLTHQDSFGEVDGERPVVNGFNAANEQRMGARWQEMQRTLNEIELTAQRSTNVFGAGHARALDDLRHAQIELARAWGRGSENHGAMDASSGDGSSTLDDDRSGDSDIHRFRAAAASTGGNRGNANGAGRQRAGTTDTVASASTALSGESEGDGPSSAPRGVGGGSSSPPERGYLEDETARDIKRASARRAANEAYFRKVESSVQDVVAKLEGVAAAMRAVESENRSLWSGSESTQTDQEGNSTGSPRHVGSLR